MTVNIGRGIEYPLGKKCIYVYTTSEINNFHKYGLKYIASKSHFIYFYSKKYSQIRK